jgi:hypothetical protein
MEVFREVAPVGALRAVQSAHQYALFWCDFIEMHQQNAYIEQGM